MSSEHLPEEQIDLRVKPHPKVCAWEEDADGIHHTDCGHSFECIDGTPPENKMHYCCYCGKVLAWCSYQPEDDSDE